ncbi:MAG: MFS transporter [Bryobacteraceae bacterium]|nr:MFS transporter [Bryobacteraceae bacterium]MDW8378761.1 MFS transporter [Bryobacterales bacterium]
MSTERSTKRAVGFLFATVFLDLLGAGILLPIIPYLVHQFRSDATTVGALSLSFSAAQFLASPVLGVLSDRYGRRPVLLFSILGSALGYFLFALANSLPLMFAARILDGITGGNISTAQAYLADISRPEDRAKNFGLIGAAFGLGFILGPALGGALSQISLHAPAYGAGILALVTAVFGYFTLPESLPGSQRRFGTFRISELNPLAPLREVLSRQELRPLLGALFVMNFAFSGLQSNFAVFTAVRLHYSPSENAWTFAYIGLLAAIVQGWLVRALSGRMTEFRMAVFGLVMLTAGFLGVAQSQRPLHLNFAIVGVSGVGLASTALTAMLTQRVGQREQGWLLGCTQSLLSVTRVFGPLWAGIAFDRMGPAAPYTSGAAFLTLALLLTYFSRSR